MGDVIGRDHHVCSHLHAVWNACQGGSTPNVKFSLVIEWVINLGGRQDSPKLRQSSILASDFPYVCKIWEAFARTVLASFSKPFYLNSG